MKKVYDNAAEALDGLLFDGMTIAAGGFGLLTLFLVRFREPEKEPEAGGAQPSLWSDSAYGWRYLKERPGLLALLYVFAGSNFVVGMLQALLTPLILSFATTGEVGSVQSIGGLGMLAGTVLGVASAWVMDRYKLVQVPGQVYFLDYVPFLVEPLDLALVLLITFLLALASAFYAAQRAASLDPIEAMFQ